MTDLTTFAIWLNQELDRRDLSKRELADAAKVDESLVYFVTNGRRTPTAQFCIAVAWALRIPTVDVLDLAGFDVIPTPGSDTDNPQLSTAWGLLQQLDDPTLAVVVRMLKGLTG